MTFHEVAHEFLAQKRIAVAGVSRKADASGNAIYKALRDHGYTVIPIHPEADTIEGDRCYPNLQAIPGGVDGVFILTRPQVSEQIMRDAVEAGVRRVWMHYNPWFGKQNSSVSDEAVTYGRAHGVTVLNGGCPMMYMDMFHKGMWWLIARTGGLPKV